MGRNFLLTLQVAVSSKSNTTLRPINRLDVQQLMTDVHLQHLTLHLDGAD
jgi:hypothetical protein